MENNEKKKNKKILIVSIVAVVILVIAIVATSFAMFTANLSGTEQNKLNTGYVTLECRETTFELSDTTALTDAEGIALTDNAATCTLVSTMNGSIKIGYDIALADIDAVSPTDGIGTDNVKVQVTKEANGDAASYLVGTSATEGVLVSSLAGKSGKYDDTITGYNIDSAVVEGNNTIVYTVKSWVSSLGDAGENTQSSKTGVCSDPAYTTQTTCETAGEIWGGSQTSSQSGGSFSFKLKVGATQTFDEDSSATNAVYSWNTTGVNLGDTLESISGYTTDYTTFGKNYFLKHNLTSDNIVESQEVCYILNGNVHCLKGCSKYNSDEGMCEVTSDEENVETLHETFGTDVCSGNSSLIECSASDVVANILYGGIAGAGNGSGASSGVEGCVIHNDGTAVCGEW